MFSSASFAQKFENKNREGVWRIAFPEDDLTALYMAARGVAVNRSSYLV